MSDEREWDIRARNLGLTQLDSVRKSAESWRNGLAGLTAVVLAAVVVKGPDEFQKLSDFSKVVVVVGFILTVTLLVAAAYCAMRASFGVPEGITNTGQDLKAWSENEASTVRCYIRWARGLTPFALAALVIVVCATWLSSAPEATSTVKITLADGSTLCGTPSDSVKNFIVITDSKKTKVPVAVSDIVAMEFGSCD